MHWVHTRHAGGSFGQLTSLTADFDDELEYEQDLSQMLWFFAGVVLTLAGNWPLQRVLVLGYFDLDMATILLPASVQHLHLSPNPRALPRIIDLASFCKFQALKALSIPPFGPWCANVLCGPLYISETVD